MISRLSIIVVIALSCFSVACPQGYSEYPAVVTSVYDGDTFTVDITLESTVRLGFNLATTVTVTVEGEKIRPYRIDAPELRGEEREEGLRSRDYLRSLIDGKALTICTNQDARGKYGRLLAEVEVEGVNVSDRMVEEGYARYKQY